MKKIRQWLCNHDYEPRSVYVDSGELLQTCRKCGKRVRTDGFDERQPPS